MSGAQQAGSAIAYYAFGRKRESDAGLALLLKEYADTYAFEIAVVFRR